MTQHPAVADWLRRLDAAARDLPAGRRAELRAELAAHLREALAGATGDAAVLAVLDRLGDPDDVVAAERDDAPAPADGRRRGALELVAVLALVLGPFVLPVVATAVGLVCALSSRVWTRRDKRTALLLAGVPWVLAVAVWAVGGAAGGAGLVLPGPHLLELVVLAVALAVAGSVVSGVLLGRRMMR